MDQETIPSAALLGLEVCRVRVEVAISRGTPMIQFRGPGVHADDGADEGVYSRMERMEFATGL